MGARTLLMATRLVLTLFGWTFGVLCLLVAVGAWLVRAGATMFGG